MASIRKAIYSRGPRSPQRPGLRPWLWYGLLLCLCAVLQSAPGLFCVGRARPAFLLALALAVAVTQPLFPAALFGALCGLVWDFLAVRPCGWLALCLLGLCLLTARLAARLPLRRFGGFFAWSALAALALLGLDLWLFYLMPGYGQGLRAFLGGPLPSALFTALAAPPVLWLVRRPLRGRS